jgi:hypothetical protein
MFMRGGRLGWGFRVGDARAPMSERRNDVEIYGYRVPQTCALGKKEE